MIVDKSEHKVTMFTVDGRFVHGYIKLAEGERLQDLMNDERKFIPMNVLVKSPSNQDDEFEVRVINKDFISYIENRR